MIWFWLISSEVCIRLIGYLIIVSAKKWPFYWNFKTLGTECAHLLFQSLHASNLGGHQVLPWQPRHPSRLEAALHPACLRRQLGSNQAGRIRDGLISRRRKSLQSWWVAVFRSNLLLDVVPFATLVTDPGCVARTLGSHDKKMDHFWFWMKYHPWDCYTSGVILYRMQFPWFRVAF